MMICLSFLIRRVDQSVYRLFTVGCDKYECEHPFDKPYFRQTELADRQFHEYLVPSFLQMDFCRFTSHAIFISQQDFIRFFLVRGCPYRRQYFLVVQPYTASFIIPLSLWRCKVHFRPAVVLEFDPGSDFLIFG